MARTSRSRGPPNYPCSTAPSPSSISSWEISARRTWRCPSRVRWSRSACRCWPRPSAGRNSAARWRASIPGVRLKNNVLTFDGNVESQVFGGRVVGSNIRLQDPLGNFPQLFADVRARDLDLGLVTQTFEVGSITGRLEADVLGLELFGWAPQAFDARLATPKGDKSRHRISAKAVSSLSNVGGGGGGVVQALQSGVLQVLRRIQLRQARHPLQAAAAMSARCRAWNRRPMATTSSRARASRASTSSATRDA